MTLAIHAKGNNKDRVIAEHKLILRLGIVQPAGLNNKFDYFKIKKLSAADSLNFCLRLWDCVSELLVFTQLLHLAHGLLIVLIFK